MQDFAISLGAARQVATLIFKQQRLVRWCTVRREAQKVVWLGVILWTFQSPGAKNSLYNDKQRIGLEIDIYKDLVGSRTSTTRPESNLETRRAICGFRAQAYISNSTQGWAPQNRSLSTRTPPVWRHPLSKIGVYFTPQCLDILLKTLSIGLSWHFE